MPAKAPKETLYSSAILSCDMRERDDSHLREREMRLICHVAWERHVRVIQSFERERHVRVIQSFVMCHERDR